MAADVVSVVRAYSNQGTLIETIHDLGKRAELAGRRADKTAPRRRTSLDRRFGQEEIDQIVAAYNSGMSSTELMTQHELGKGSILKLLHEHGAAVRRQGLTAEQVDRIAVLYAEGRSSKRLAADYGVSPATVLSALRCRGGAIRRYRQLAEYDIDRAIEWYQYGRSLSWIGRQFGSSHSTISQLVERRGIPRRDC